MCHPDPARAQVTVNKLTPGPDPHPGLSLAGMGAGEASGPRARRPEWQMMGMANALRLGSNPVSIPLSDPQLGDLISATRCVPAGLKLLPLQQLFLCEP